MDTNVMTNLNARETDVYEKLTTREMITLIADVVECVKEDREEDIEDLLKEKNLITVAGYQEVSIRVHINLKDRDNPVPERILRRIFTDAFDAMDGDVGFEDYELDDPFTHTVELQEATTEGVFDL